MCHQFCLYILYYLHCGNSLTLNKPSEFPSTTRKLSNLSKKRKQAATKKAKAAALAAAAADATAAAAAANVAADAAADAASHAVAAAVVPAARSGSGIATHRCYAAAVADGPAVAGETTSVNAASVASLPLRPQGH